MTALELVLSPDDAERLPRLKLVTGLKAGRLRRHAVEIVWHDTADGALAQQGLALAESLGSWRLERLVPGAVFWPPGAPAPVEAQAASLDLINQPLPSGLLKVARFDGVLTVLPLMRDGTTITLGLLRGTLGSGRKRRAVGRVTLVGHAPDKNWVGEAAAREMGAHGVAARKAGARDVGAAEVGGRKVGLREVRAHEVRVLDGGARDGSARNGGARDGSARNGGARDGVARDGGAREGGARDGGARDGGARDGGVGHGAAGEGEAGAEAAVFALAAALAEELDVAIPTASLAAEARAAATGTAPAPRHHGAPHLPPGLTVAAAFGFVLGHLADVILFNAPLAAAGRDGPEPVHEMRVAVRRLRSAIAVFRPAGGCPAIDAASLGLKALADRLAPARDWDVFVAETAVTVAKALPDDPSLRRLRAAAERRRRHAYAELRAWLATPDFRRLGIALAGLAGGRAWMAPLEPKQLATLALGLDEFASRALARRLHRLASAGKAIEHLDPEALHAIRLHAKRMRYVAEVFAPLYPGKPTRRFMRRLATLQDRLGRLNDGSVANGLLGELGARAHAAGLVRGFLAARSDDTRGRIARAWERFHRLEPFWS